MRSRVTPGVSSTMAARRPVSLLKSMDLPTFGRPTIATKGLGIAQASSLRQSAAGSFSYYGTKRFDLQGTNKNARKQSKTCRDTTPEGALSGRLCLGLDGNTVLLYKLYTGKVLWKENHTLARFLEQGRYEQHLNRMKTRYRQKRDAVIDAIRRSPLSDRAEILEQDAGLHFLMVLPTDLDDRSLRRRAEAMGLRLALLSDYYSQPAAAPQHILVVNYAGIDMDRLPEGLRRLAQLWEEPSCMTN